MTDDYYDYVRAALRNADDKRYERRAQVYAMLAAAEAMRQQAEACTRLTERIVEFHESILELLKELGTQ